MSQKFCQEITNKEVWEEFLLKCEEKTFLQSWNWEEFQERNGLPAGRQGNKIWRLGIFENVQHSVLHNVAMAVKETFEKIKEFCKKGDIVLLESRVPVQLTDSLMK